MKRAVTFSLLLALAGSPAIAQDRRPTHENLKYGPHARNVMDVWLAKSDAPAPVADIHGLCCFAHLSSPSPYRTPSHTVGSSGVVQSTRCFLNAGILMKSPTFISTMPSSNCNLAAPFSTITHSCCGWSYQKSA